MFGAIAQTFGKLFGTDKAVESIVNNVSTGLDKLVYTDEEKAQDAAKERSEARQMIIRWLEATKGQNLARRIIALSIVFVWLFQYMVAQFLNVIAIWVSSVAQAHLQESASILMSGANDMGKPIMVILGFYFAAPYLGNIIGNWKGVPHGTPSDYGSKR